jgi:dolichyl-phosphooligosaccharide-protein glycotransferase
LRKSLAATVVSTSILLAFGLRVFPAYHAVFAAHGISFEEPDAWFHMRNIHNLLAHFPRHSGFDPYGLYPRGANIVTGPFWDYIVGSIAWMAGLGSPSEYLTDELGAWLPPILGALLPIPVFLLARRLFGTFAGTLSAVWVATIPGTFLWVGHLGMADHHAAEVLESLIVLTVLCAASETQGPRRWIMATLSGVALAAYLATQVTGIYVPAILAVAAVLSPAIAGISAVAIGTACLPLLAASATTWWPDYMWMSLIGGLAIAAPLAWLNEVGRKRNWSRGTLYGAAVIAALVALGCVALLQPAKLRDLIRLLQTYRPERPGADAVSQVKEMEPLWLVAPGGFASLFSQFGVAWVLAVPGLAGAVWMAWRGRRPALTLFAVWSLTMIYGVFSHVRQAAYTGIAVAIGAGIATAWIARRIPDRGHLGRLRALAAAILLLAGMAVSLPIGFAQTHPGQGPDADWWAALNWMRWNTPEPLGDPLAWYRWSPKLGQGTVFSYPSSAYGVIALWDKGWWINGMARRIPASNGGQRGAFETSLFLTDTNPGDALAVMRKIHARYAAIGPGSITFELPSLVALAGRRIDEYSRIFQVQGPGGKRTRVRVYLPDFYRSMAARLYLFGGHRIDTLTHGVEVFLTTPELVKPGEYEETIQSVRNFPSEYEAEQWMAQHPNETANLASADATVSCVDLEEIPWLKRVFVSRNEQVVGSRQPSAVEIFELTQ